MVCSENLGIGLASAVDQPREGDSSGTSDLSYRSLAVFCHPYFKKARAASGFCLPGAAIRLPRPAATHCLVFTFGLVLEGLFDTILQLFHNS